MSRGERPSLQESVVLPSGGEALKEQEHSRPFSVPGSDSIPVVLADLEEMFLDSLRRALQVEPGIDVVGTATSWASAVQLAEQLRPRIIILDYQLVASDSAVSGTTISCLSGHPSVILLTARGDALVLTFAVETGCAGVVTKHQTVQELLSAIRLIDAGEAYLSPQVIASLLPRMDRRFRRIESDLTVRELQVLQLAAAGLANKQIASHLNLSLHTVRNHVQSMLVKLGAHSKLEAVAVAEREGLLRRPE